MKNMIVYFFFVEHFEVKVFGPKNACPSCNTECNENEITCTKPSSVEDCPDIHYCLPMNCGNSCPQIPSCSSDEMPCIKPNEIEGCPHIHYCLPMKDENDCNNHCPFNCADECIPLKSMLI